MDYGQIAICLLLVGLAVIFAEIFIPSGGLLALFSASCLLAAVYCAYTAWWETSPNSFWGFVVAAVVATPVVAGCALYVFPYTPVGKAALLEPPKADELQGDTAHERHLKSLVGETGRTVNMLTPGGIVLVDGERVHCESEGMLIEPNTEVEIVGIRGARLVVRERVEKPAEAEDFGDRPAVAQEDDPPIDFEISPG